MNTMNEFSFELHRVATLYNWFLLCRVVFLYEHDRLNKIITILNKYIIDDALKI
jgi:hypothetical protein